MELTEIRVQRQQQLVSVLDSLQSYLILMNNNFLLSTACEEEWRRLAQSAAETRLLSPGMQQIPNQMRAQQGTPLGSIFKTDVNLQAYISKLHLEPTFTGAPLILSPRMSVPTTGASLLSSQPTLDHSGLIYAAAPFTDYTNYAALAAAGNPLLTDYADHTGGLFAR